MEQVTELFPGRTANTRVWVTARGRKEYDGMKNVDIAALFESRTEKGFQGVKLKREGIGVWAFGTRGRTTRIAGYFPDENTRADFVVGGVWEGKRGSGDDRPPYGDTVVGRCETLRQQGVRYVQ